MTFQPNAVGVRGRRIKDAIYKMLRDHPEGMSASEMYDRLKTTKSVRRSITSSSQVSAHAKSLPGVEHEKSLVSVPTGMSRHKPLIFVLADADAWPDKLGDLWRD